MEAIYTTSGMVLTPYKPSKMERILRARSVWMNGPRGHKVMKPTTAFVMSDGNIRQLVTYYCHPRWLQEIIPDIEITRMPKNRSEELGEPFALNADVMPNELQSMCTQTVLEKGFKNAFFNIPTGAGKTLLAIYLTSLINRKAWIMCYRSAVLDQWVRTMRDKTTCNMKRVKIVSKGTDLMKMATGEWHYEDYDIYLSTPRILTMFAEKQGLGLLNDVFDNCGIGVKYFDEAHYNVGNITKINGLTNVERTYYLSADFGQPEASAEKLYFKMFGNIPIMQPNMELAKSMQYTVGIIARYNTHPSIVDVNSCFSGYGFSRHKFMEYQLTKNAFYHAFTSVLDSIRTTSRPDQFKVLVLVGMIEHVNYLKKWLEDYYAKHLESHSPRIVRYHSDMPEDEREEALEYGQVIVSTYQSMGVGIDLKRIRYVLSLVPVNTIEDNQAAGRARALEGGEDCFYFIFVDDGFEYVKKKLPDRLAYLEAHKIKKIASIKYS